ncbi:peptidoglycan/LPS O-acetylase OafA/YrhL [Murinocardiopsis flavida]|uniref:Peptidoglycan/LPS O-acetylase OafA/YrhL n=1 Tax=Murinocardiopsis flavida TaxID=645275 RepID=A0A2P8DIS5_9ACTN|nr:acyltransferase family protein [Murinocardiopsis flavida]PSK97101.1 peptidoglycan/LPS O-acetylase OafA/YrhL [Murinocardiopsis flavida]
MARRGGPRFGTPAPAPKPSRRPVKAAAVQSPPTAPGAKSGYRPEIQGLRAVAVLLVAVYHVWLGRVSGGVDVFLLLTGFLITGSLVRAVERDGGVGLLAFWSRLLRRLSPAAGVVLLGVLAATALFLPKDRWRDTIGEAVAAALYHENYRLAFNAVDYLAQDVAASPVQHFWSLSIQGQFYIVWPLLVAAAAWAAARRRLPVRKAVAAALVLVFAASLAYSVYITGADQRWAYFDTGARLWEFALGGLLVLALPHLNPPRVARIALGWGGLAALVLCGLLLQVSTVFPGYAALWPTLAAGAIVVAGGTGSRFGADRLLTLRPLLYVGGISYALYLWHWPVLVCYLAVTDRTAASPVGGAAVLAVSVALAAATKAVVEDGVPRLTRARTTPMWSAAVGAACLAPMLVASGGWSAALDAEQREREAFVADPANYPGALAARNGGSGLRDLPVYPAPAEAADDVPESYPDGCNQNVAGSEVLTCEYGDPSAERTVALVGGSHAAHWLPALAELGEDHGWRVVNIVKGACLFTDLAQTYKGEDYPACAEWNEGVLRELADLGPDVVFSTATTSSIDKEAGFGGEVVVDGYVDRWRELDALGIDVVGVRDTPRFGFDVAECVAEKGPEGCVGHASPSLERTSPLADLTESGDVPDNVSFVDVNDLLCEDGRCPSVIGNVLVYWDNAHFTATFARTLAPAIEDELKAAMGAGGR